MDTIYFDNASTAFPKAKGVGDAIKYYLDEVGSNIKRGTTLNDAEDVVYETRELLCDYLGFDNPQNLVFTQNVTYGINMLINGLIEENDHIVVSSVEHNAVLRPLNSLEEKRNIEVTRVKCDHMGRFDLEDFRQSIRSSTKAVIMTHASNVCGTMNPIKEIGEICHEKGVYFIIDSAQTAGKVDLNSADLHADAIAFTGHKGFLGPQGIGGFCASTELSKKLKPFIMGGTGSFSENEIQPSVMPDKFESGTLNIPGIYGLNVALKYVLKNQKDILRKELELTKVFIDGVKDIENIKLIGSDEIRGRMAVVSLDFGDLDNGEVCYTLSKDYRVLTRSGMHCAPSAHSALGTFPNGTLRFSFGHKNTFEEVEYVVDAIKKIVG